MLLITQVKQESSGSRKTKGSKEDLWNSGRNNHAALASLLRASCAGAHWVSVKSDWLAGQTFLVDVTFKCPLTGPWDSFSKGILFASGFHQLPTSSLLFPGIYSSHRMSQVRGSWKWTFFFKFFEGMWTLPWPFSFAFFPVEREWFKSKLHFFFFPLLI